MKKGVGAMSNSPTDRGRNLDNQGYDDEEDDEPLSWRAETSERIRWEMFLRNFSPDGDLPMFRPLSRNSR